MKIRRTTQTDSDFYLLMGPVFGSREIERATHDRFFDDPGKVWYVASEGTASVLNGVIRNFYAADEETALALLDVLTSEYANLRGTVPRTWRTAFLAAGFSVEDHSRNFIEVDL